MQGSYANDDMLQRRSAALRPGGVRDKPPEANQKKNQARPPSVAGDLSSRARAAPDASRAGQQVTGASGASRQQVPKRFLTGTARGRPRRFGSQARSGGRLHPSWAHHAHRRRPGAAPPTDDGSGRVAHDVSRAPRGMFFCLDPAAGPQVLPPGSVLPPGAVPMLQPPPPPDAEMADVYRKPPTKKKKATAPQPVYYQAPQPAQTRGTSKAAALSTKRRWSKHEDEKLCAAVKAVGLGDWKTIANVYMRGHDLSDAQCMHRWQKVLRPGLVKGAFCEKEDKVRISAF
jgi:hypothetical protein